MRAKTPNTVFVLPTSITSSIPVSVSFLPEELQSNCTLSGRTHRAAQNRANAVLRTYLQKAARVEAFSDAFEGIGSSCGRFFDAHGLTAYIRRAFGKAAQDRFARARLREQVAVFAVQRF